MPTPRFMPCEAANSSPGTTYNGHCFCGGDECCFCRRLRSDLRVNPNSTSPFQASSYTWRGQPIGYEDYMVFMGTPVPPSPPKIECDDDGTEELKD